MKPSAPPRLVAPRNALASVARRQSAASRPVATRSATARVARRPRLPRRPVAPPPRATRSKPPTQTSPLPGLPGGAAGRRFAHGDAPRSPVWRTARRGRIAPSLKRTICPPETRGATGSRTSQPRGGKTPMRGTALPGVRHLAAPHASGPPPVRFRKVEGAGARAARPRWREDIWIGRREGGSGGTVLFWSWRAK